MTKNLSTLLLEREVSRTPVWFGDDIKGSHQSIQAHTSLVKRLVCDAVLKKHEGCVNRLAWNKNGSLLASGSDDTNVILWDYSKKKPKHVIETGHSRNIFGVCFVAGTNDHLVASGGMDCEVRLHYAPFRPEGSKRIGTHRGRVKDVISSVPNIVWSGGEDGHVRQFDVRTLENSNDTSNILINLGRIQSTREISVMGMSAHPLDPTKIALACGDHYIRLYDRRMLRDVPSIDSMSHSHTMAVNMFSPPHMHYHLSCDISTRKAHARSHGTSVQFNCDGSQLLCSYHHDNIYLFNVNSGSSEQYELPWQNGMHMDETIVKAFRRLNAMNHLAEGNRLLEENHPTHAINLLQSHIGSSGEFFDSSHQHQLYSVLARSYLSRNWRGDAYVALQYCYRALDIDQNDPETRVLFVEALAQSGRKQEAANEAKVVSTEFPWTMDTLESYMKLNEDSFDGHECPSDIGQESDAEEAIHEDVDPEESNSISSSGISIEDETKHIKRNNIFPVTTDVIRRYLGYCNVQTDIKESKFFGLNDKFVVAGSDDGRAYIWDKENGELIHSLEADQDIVNCVQCHPFDPCLATSGIEDVIRLWSPLSPDDSTPSKDEMDELVLLNQSQMTQEEREPIDINVNPPLIQLLLQDDHGGVHTCAPS